MGAPEDGNVMVQLGEDIVYHPLLKLLICKLHGNGLHPTVDAIKRHLRGQRHRSRGQALTRVLHAMAKLPLASLPELYDFQATEVAANDQITLPIQYLKVLDGWACSSCEGAFMTTSLEIVQRHAAAVHGRKRGGRNLWDACLLQTFFIETKDRRYFRVPGQAGIGSITMIEQETPTVNPWGDDTQQCESKTAESALISLSRGSYHSSWDLSSGSTPVLNEFEIEPDFSTFSPSQVSRRLNVPQTIVPRHPFMSVAEKYVPLPRPRLDYLLKSGAFRSASMPIFDSNSTDVGKNMQSVFPESEESPVWANALLYSTVQIMNRGAETAEGHLLLRRTVYLMNGKLSSPDETLCSAAVGAIMVLKATAYKTHDLVAHDMHTKGLAKVLEYLKSTGGSLTPAARKAMFWLDLAAAANTGSERQMSHLHLPPVIWRREIRPEVANCLPAGFVRHRDALPYGLPECIADLEEFQLNLKKPRVASISRSDQHALLESMQASIESRLLFQAQACRQLGAIAEAVRLAVYICTYSTWMETWNDGSLPCRLAIGIFDLIESMSISTSLESGSAWLGRMDLFFWLVFVSSSAAEHDEGQVESVKTRRDSLLDFVSSRLPYFARRDRVDLKTALQEALNDFVYVDGWKDKRGFIKSWHQLELRINSDIG